MTRKEKQKLIKEYAKNGKVIMFVYANQLKPIETSRMSFQLRVNELRDNIKKVGLLHPLLVSMTHKVNHCGLPIFKILDGCIRYKALTDLGIMSEIIVQINNLMIC